MPTQEVVGDLLQAAIQQAAQALQRGDERALWQALDGPGTARAMIDWDRLRGRPTPSDEELEQGRRDLADTLRASGA